MKVLILGLNYAPELTGVGKYTSEFAEWLVEQGHEVRSVSAPPYYPEWRVQRPYRAWRYAQETLKGVKVFRSPLWVPRKPSGAKRLLHLASFAAMALPSALRQVSWRPDVVLVVAPALASAPVGLLIAGLSGARSWLHIQDFELDAAFELGLLKGRLRSLAEWGERKLLRRFDVVSSISGAMTERLASKGVERRSIVLFPNWVDTAAFLHGRDEREAFFGAASKGRKVVLYSGNMGEKQGLDAVLDAAEALQTSRPDLLFVLCGDGAAKSRLVAKAEAKRLSNVQFLPLQPAEVMPSFLASADLHLVIQKRGAADLVMPSKLVGILASGGAAVVTADEGTELHRTVAGHGIGHVIPPEDTAALTHAIDHLLSAEVDLNAVRRHARAYAVAHLDRAAVLARAFASAAGQSSQPDTKTIADTLEPTPRVYASRN